MEHPLLILNTPVLTADGDYSLDTITPTQARSLARTRGIDSAVGHDATAQALGQLLDMTVPVNRQQASQEVGQCALVFKLRARLPEGEIVNQERLNQVGWDLKLLTRNS